MYEKYSEQLKAFHGSQARGEAIHESLLRAHQQLRLVLTGTADIPAHIMGGADALAQHEEVSVLPVNHTLYDCSSQTFCRRSAENLLFMNTSGGCLR